MPWIDGDFDATSNSNGEIVYDGELVAPASGRLIGYRVETTSGCEQRAHATVLVIVRADDPDDKLEIGPIDVPDCEEKRGIVDFKVRKGKTYLSKLQSKGFKPSETVKGKAGVNYSLI